HVSLIAGQLVGEYLDRDLPAAFLLIAEVNRTHAAFAEPAENLAVAEATQLRRAACLLGGAVVPGRRSRCRSRRRKRPGGVDLRSIQGDANFLSLNRAKQVLIHQAVEDIG